MMRPLLAILVLGSLSLSGCGTFSDAMCGPIDDHVYYRGVRLDAQAVQEGGPKVLMAADIPFSAVADTVLIPYLAYHELTDPPPTSPPALTQERTKADQHTTNTVPPIRPGE
jgi:uncharacterized protein YceK